MKRPLIYTAHPKRPVKGRDSRIFFHKDRMDWETRNGLALAKHLGIQVRMHDGEVIVAYFPLKGNPKEYLPGAPVARLTPLLMKGSGERNTHLDYKLNYSVSTTQPSGSVALHGKTTTLTCALSLMVGVMETNKYWASLSDEDMKAIHRVDKEEEGTS